MEGRKAIEARLAALIDELSARGVKNALPSQFPETEDELDALALELLRVHRKHPIAAAFELLFEVAAPSVGRLVLDQLRLLPVDLEAEEIVAQVFLELFKASDRKSRLASSDGSFHSLATSLVDAAITNAIEAPADTSPHQASGAAIPFGLSREELRQIVEQSFAILPPLTQRCFYLHLVEGRSYADIAHELKLSLRVVTERMNEAREKAFELAQEYYENLYGGQKEWSPEPPGEDDELEGGVT
ncbi:MAG: sigma-70 family RNA polymerase sigma factor [Planctomycetota bacterium]